MGRPQQNRIFRFLKLNKAIAFYPNRKKIFTEVHCMKHRIRWENKSFDDIGTLSTGTYEPTGFSISLGSGTDFPALEPVK